METAGPYRAFRQQPPNTGFSRKRKRRPRMAAETPPLPQTDWMRKQARTAPRDPSFPAEKDADAETATAVRLPSADRDHPVINNAGEKNRKPANGPEQSVKEKRRTANPESFHRFFLRFFIVMKVDLCYHKGT